MRESRVAASSPMGIGITTEDSNEEVDEETASCDNAVLVRQSLRE